MSTKNCSSKAEQIQMVLEELVRAANEICQFSQRETDLTAERFVQTVVLGWLHQADASLNELASYAQGLGIRVTGSAIHERISPASVELLGRVLVGALRQIVPHHRLPIEVLARFTAIHITDSTQIALPQSLMPEFRGNQTNAMLKLQVTIDYLSGQWVGFEMQDGKSPDQNCDLPLKQAIAGSLNVFDLGYYKQERLRDMIKQDAYFVSRYQSQTALYKPETTLPFDLIDWLQSLEVNEAQCRVDLGSRLHLPLRLVVRRLSLASADARRRKAKKRAKKEGKTCSKSYLFLLGWDILITNLSEAMWSLAQIFDLYPIRTQIEWLFRLWKSQLKVDHFGNWRSERVLTQLYAHLIGALLCQRLWAGWHWREGCEYSLFKCVQIIQDCIPDLIKCIARNWWGVKQWHIRLEATFQYFAHKTKRKKTPSTCQTFINWGLS